VQSSYGSWNTSLFFIMVLHETAFSKTYVVTKKYSDVIT